MNTIIANLGESCISHQSTANDYIEFNHDDVSNSSTKHSKQGMLVLTPQTISQPLHFTLSNMLVSLFFCCAVPFGPHKKLSKSEQARTTVAVTLSHSQLPITCAGTGPI